MLILTASYFYLLLFVISIALTYLVKKYALKKSILDIPNQRSSHKQPVPRGGGLAFVTTFYLAIFYLYAHHLIAEALFLALLGGIPVAVIGYFDDLKPVKSLIRVGVHIFAAFWGIICLGWVHFLYFGATQPHSTVIFSFFALGFTVWLINLYNFMDGIDGIAALQTIFVATTAGAMLLGFGYISPASVCFVLAASVSGFLVWNWPPAKIFMGDVGSGFLGYVLAMVMWSSNNIQQLPVAIWWILSAVFICDATFTLIKRMRRGEKWYSAHCEHVYQRLVQAGYSHGRVTIGVLLVNVFICLPLSLLYFKWHTALSELSYILGIVFVAWLMLKGIARVTRYTH